MSSLSPAPTNREDYLMFAVAEHFRALAALAHGDIEGATVLQESGSDARKLYDNYLDGWWDSGLPLQPGEPLEHWSSCAVHNEPAYPAGPCDCGGYRPEAEA